jgi:tungstate transport system ATP-binding protein
MTASLYEVRNVKKVFGTRCVLNIAALDVRQGEVLALVGPSGAGKSTLLQLLNFLQMPTTGTIRFGATSFGPGQDVPLGVRRQVTTVFQRPVLLKRTVEANVSYGLGLRGQRDAHERVQTALEEVGLAHLGRQPARTLSGGEAQRVALARALVLRPQALLLDEPTANLDPYNVGLIEQIVRRENREQGITVVLVTHNVYQARRMADRVALLLEGQIVELDETHAFFEAPSDPRTRAFVQGDMVY